MNAVITVRVIAPSGQWDLSKDSAYKRAEQLLAQNGVRISYGRFAKEVGFLKTVPLTQRVADFEEAYADESVDAIWALDGGYFCNALLDRVDWSVVRQNPKPIIGYSDISVLLNAIYAKTGQAGLMGPVFTTLTRRNARKSTLDSVVDALRGFAENRVEPMSESWKVLRAGNAEGVLLGGNLGSLYLLQGTTYMPAFDESIILAIEDDDESAPATLEEFDRRLRSLFQQKLARQNIVGLLIGRFQPKSRVAMEDLQRILDEIAPGIPAIADMDFGHTLPMRTLTIGRKVRMNASKRASLEYVSGGEQ